MEKKSEKQENSEGFVPSKRHQNPKGKRIQNQRPVKVSRVVSIWQEDLVPGGEG